MSSLNRRRSVVAVAVVASLFAAALTIRVAASWTAGAAPITERPPDAGQLLAQLADEAARAAALSDQLQQVSVQSGELRAALETARDKAAADAAAAADLSAQLEQARAKLASLEAQLATAAGPAVVTVSRPAPAASSTGEGEHEEEGEDHEVEHD